MRSRRYGVGKGIDGRSTARQRAAGVVLLLKARCIHQTKFKFIPSRGFFPGRASGCLLSVPTSKPRVSEIEGERTELADGDMAPVFKSAATEQLKVLMVVFLMASSYTYSMPIRNSNAANNAWCGNPSREQT